MPVVIVPGLAVVVVALFALLFLYAVKLFAQALAAIIPKGLPIIGDSLHNIIAAAAALGSAAVEGIMGGLIRPIINLILGPVFAFLNWIRDIEHLAASVAGELNWLVLHGVTDALRAVERTVRAWVSAARTYALALVHHLATALVHDLAVVKAAVLSTLSHWVNTLEHLVTLARVYALTLVHNLAADVVHDIALARTYALGLTNHLATAVTRDIGRIEATIKGLEATSTALVAAGVAQAIKVSEAYSAAAIDKAINLVDVEGAKVLAAAWPGIIDDVDALAGVVAADLPDIGAALRSIPRAIPTDIAGALAAAGALAIPAIRYMRECGVPNCRNLSKYGRDLAELSDLVGAGALLAMLAEIVTDPAGAARDTESAAGSLLTGAISAARGLLGV